MCSKTLKEQLYPMKEKHKTKQNKTKTKQNKTTPQITITTTSICTKPLLETCSSNLLHSLKLLFSLTVQVVYRDNTTLASFLLKLCALQNNAAIYVEKIDWIDPIVLVLTFFQNCVLLDYTCIMQCLENWLNWSRLSQKELYYGKWIQNKQHFRW